MESFWNLDGCFMIGIGFIDYQLYKFHDICALFRFIRISFLCQELVYQIQIYRLIQFNY